MSDLQLAREFAASGIDHDEIRNRVRSGDLHRVRRGAYVGATERTLEERHRLRVRAAYAVAESDSVVSFGSAAVLHDLPVARRALDHIHLTRSRNSGGRIRKDVHVHVAPLAGDEITTVDGLQITGLARTFVDVARTSTLDWAAATGDAALRSWMDPAAVVDELERAQHRHGIRTARRAAGLLDPRSESAGESRSRVVMLAQGIPLPELQVEIDGPDGFEARVDFLWHNEGVIGEFDGKVKYGRLLLPGETPEDAVFREKIREDRLRELGFIVVRWIWDDLRYPERLAGRLNRAFELSRRIH